MMLVHVKQAFLMNNPPPIRNFDICLIKAIQILYFNCIQYRILQQLHIFISRFVMIQILHSERYITLT